MATGCCYGGGGGIGRRRRMTEGRRGAKSGRVGIGGNGEVKSSTG